MKKYIADIKENEEGEVYIEFPEEVMSEVGWQEGDDIVWTDNGDGSWSLTKKEDETLKNYLVETVVTYRMRYVVKAKDSTHATDEVVMNENDPEFKEFSQLYLGSHVSSVRELSDEDVLKVCDEDNDYVKNWSDEKKIEVFVNVIDYKEDNEN
jgi:hypothetical protein